MIMKMIMIDYDKINIGDNYSNNSDNSNNNNNLFLHA